MGAFQYRKNYGAGSLFFSFLTVVLLAVANPAFAVDTFFALEQSIAKNSKPVETLSLYPESVLNSVFEVAGQPGLLVKAADISQKLRNQLGSFVAQFPASDQKELWSILQYPKMVDDLVAGGVKSPDRLTRVLSRYPAGFRLPVFRLYNRAYPILYKARQLNQEIYRDLMALIQNYPAGTQEAFKKMVRFPEVLQLLDENLDLTILLGDAWKKNPGWLQSKMKDIRLKAARENAKSKDLVKKINTPSAKYDNKPVTQPGSSSYQVSSGSSNRSSGQVTVHNHYYPRRYYGYSSWYPRFSLGYNSYGGLFFGLGILAPLFHFSYYH